MMHDEKIYGALWVCLVSASGLNLTSLGYLYKNGYPSKLANQVG